MVPLNIIRNSAPGPLRAPHSTAGCPFFAPSYMRPLKLPPKTLTPSTVVTSSTPGHGVVTGPTTVPQTFAAPFVDADVDANAPVPSGHRPYVTVACDVHPYTSTVAPKTLYKRASSTAPSPKPKAASSTRDIHRPELLCLAEACRSRACCRYRATLNRQGSPWLLWDCTAQSSRPVYRRWTQLR